MFYTYGVDISNTKSMWNFLKNHFTYYSMNSWNGSRSIAHNVKLYKLNLQGDWAVALRYLTDAADSGGLQAQIDDEIKEFHRNNLRYEVGFNGRSYGYLVLYPKHKHDAVLPSCVSDFDSYIEFKEYIKAGWNGYKVTDFVRELRDAVEIVREFDKLCDRLRDLVNEYSKRDFELDKLTDAVERFYYEYEADLEDLCLAGPEVEENKIKLNDIRYYNAYMNCFFECFGDDRRRIDYDTTHLWLKEN